MPRSLVFLLILAITQSAPAEDPARSGIDLANRYHFVERYAAREEQARPGLVGAYQVAAEETTRESVVMADGRAPEPVAVVRTSIYNERPVEVSSLGAVAATIRTYTRHDARPDEPAGLAGLTVWYRPVLNELPQILSLAPDRRLRESDYEFAAHQVFLPGLTALLPNSPVRVGDNWRVSRRAAQALLGEPEARAEGLVARLAELRRDRDGKSTQAAITVNGRVPTPTGEILVNAEILFSFPTPGPTADPAATSGVPIPAGLIEARGAITSIRLARVASGPASGASEKGARYRSRVELILERKLGASATGGTPPRPVEAPKPNEANSWLTASDPGNRISLRHPQDLLPPDRRRFATPRGSAPILLARTGPEGRDLVRVEVANVGGTPEGLKEMLKAQWAQSKLEILPGDEGWLPESEWPEMKVYRVEAALKVTNRNPRGSRIHYDAYLVQLAKGSSLTVIATTTGDAIIPFRRDVETMIRTIRARPGGGE